MKEVKQFQTESKELLNLMINSIYSNNEIFLRELISNASDAIDKYKYASLTSDGKIPLVDPEIRISLDKKNRTITISDNGIGMNKDELINNLGTIARSGSKDFVNKIKEAKEKQDLDIIGQFGVGFYSAFMVANKIEVRTKAYNEQAYLFASEGEDSYSIEEISKDSNGTEITLYLKKSSKEVDYDSYLEEYQIKSLVKKYSDYIRYPIKMICTSSKQKLDKDGKPIEGEYEDVKEDTTLNSMIPLWKKNKNEVKDEDLNNFYKEKFMDYEDPLISLFVRVDGKITYDSLLYIPSHAPYDLYSDSYEKGLQLYSKGVFIKDKCSELIPDYLKFVKGLVDSPDLNLNISREILQQSPILKKISENVEKKVVEKLIELKKTDFDKYVKFWEAFGEHIKFGIYSTYGTKKDLLQDALIFHSLLKDKYISLAEYKEAMDKKQKYIYYASGETVEAIKLLPQIEKYRKDGVDVLLLDKKIDEFAIMMLREYEKIEFKSISNESTDDLSKEEKEKVESLSASNKRLLDNIKDALKGEVDDVIISNKLVDAPVCVSTKEGLSLEMEKTLNEQPGSEEKVKAQKVLEINPDHELFNAFSAIQDQDDLVKEYASVLLDEAMMLEGREVKDKKEFVKKLNGLMIKALAK
ncbi:MAG: molecular chaperone HtpG [Erysipelotrichaceae bacterium]|jgi:molecular chaperone HtpG|nr:molecular chaperone HtpG [Erysipelotrichaceae bacterium]